MSGLRLIPLFPQFSYKRTTTLRYNLPYFRLPLEAWKFVELRGNIVHSSTYAPITSRDKLRKIASLELLERLIEEYDKTQGQPDKVQQWLKQKEQEYENDTQITVRGAVPFFALHVCNIIRSNNLGCT
jgi:hypothetical protein